MNSQITFESRPALAVLLMALSASTVLAEVNNVRFKGAFDGRDTGVVQGGNLLLSGPARVRRSPSVDSLTLQNRR